jgi:hypothetical protein
MGYLYKTYSDTKEVMKKYVNATEGAIIYSIGKTRLMSLAAEASAIYKVGNSALVNTEIFEAYLEQFHEPSRSLPKHIWKRMQELDGGRDSPYELNTPKIGVK